MNSFPNVLFAFRAAIQPVTSYQIRTSIFNDVSKMDVRASFLRHARGSVIVVNHETEQTMTSRNSAWFRHAVLFWKSQGVSDDNLSETSATKPVSAKLERKTKVSARKSKQETGISSKELKRKNSKKIKKCDKTCEFETSEESLRKSSGDEVANHPSDEVTSNPRENSSPHLTLQFPTGSSIQNNPLYFSAGESVVLNVNGEIKKNSEELRSCSEVTIVGNTAKVQDTVREVSRETFMNNPNDVMAEWLSNIKPPDIVDDFNEENADLSEHELTKAFDPARDRLDSGLQSTCCDSPYPSPYTILSGQNPQDDDSGCCDIRVTRPEIKSCPVESDFSSDWSPISTLESIHRKDSLEPPQNHTTTRGCLYDESEICAVRKFVSLASQIFQKSGNDGRSAMLENISTLADMKVAIESQKKEFRVQQETCLRELGELLLQVMHLKNQQTSVHAQQAASLALMKSQLENYEKAQKHAHNEALGQMKYIRERLDASTEPTGNRVYGEIVWKITDLKKKLEEAKTGISEVPLVSAPFVTNEYGYKMNAWLYLNGRGNIWNSYLSVYVCVVVGEFDPILPWPIQPSYKFTLIDQRDNPTCRENIIRVRNVIDIACRGTNIIAQNGGIPRPSESTKALIVGFDDFVQHKELLSNNYVAEDTMFLKVQVEM